MNVKVGVHARKLMVLAVIMLAPSRARGLEVRGVVTIGNFMTFDEEPGAMSLAIDINYHQMRQQAGKLHSKALNACVERNHLKGPDASLACAITLVALRISYCRVRDILALRGTYKQLYIYIQVGDRTYARLRVKRAVADHACSQQKALPLDALNVSLIGPQMLPTYLHKPVLPTGTAAK